MKGKRALFPGADRSKFMKREIPISSSDSGSSAAQRGADGTDFIRAALDFVRGGLSPDRDASGPPTPAREKANLREWADRLGLQLSFDQLPAKIVRGGQEHELFHDESTDRYFKVTRN